MWKILSIFVLLSALSCQLDEERFNFCTRMLSISKSIPVEFWLNGEQTFNQTEEVGVERICFKQLFQAGDEIKLQIQDSTNLAYDLVIKSFDGVELDRIEFVDYYNVGVYEVNFTPNALTTPITNQLIKLEIQQVTLGAWTERVSAADNNWFSLAYGNGVFVAVALSGTGTRVMYSTDAGVTWSTATNPEDNLWRSVTYGNGLFVAVSSDGTNRVMTSPDGINWTARSASAALAWHGVGYGNGLFVAVAQSSATVMTSPDGITWTSRTGAVSLEWRAVTYGNGLYVAVASSGTGNRVMTSPDGITWTSRTSAADNEWWGITYGKGKFVATAISGSADRVMYSFDGITWTSAVTPDRNYRRVQYGGGWFVAVDGSGFGKSIVSANGITWTELDEDPTANFWNGVAFGESTFVGVSNSGTGDRAMTLALVQTLAAYSDWISIKETHAKSILFQYNNDIDFDDVIYSLATPPTFYIRFDAKFYVPNVIQESEEEDSGDGTIDVLYRSIKSQRKLELDPLPPYFFDKMARVLAHKNLTARGKTWTADANLTPKELDSKYPLFPSEVWLTQKTNNLTTNVYG